MVITDRELLIRQAALQADADKVVEDLGLTEILARAGNAVRTGSSALGLMVARDIDITTLCATLDAGSLFALMSPLVVHPRVRKMTFRNDTGHWNIDPQYPDGLYWMIEYVADDGVAWSLDLWFLREGTTQFDLEHMVALPPRLTDEARLAILRIKTARAEAPSGMRLPSYEIYRAVLDHGVRTPAEFEQYLETVKA